MAWNLPLAAPLLALAAVYAVGAVRLRATAAGRRALPAWRPAAFGVGLVAVAVALVSPLEALAGRRLAWHMAQHVLLVVVAAPLLAAGLAETVVGGALDAGRRLSAQARSAAVGWRGAASVPRLLVAATAVHLVVLVAWHAPALYEAAVANGALHAAEHVLFLGTAYAIWSLIARRDRRSRLGRGVAVLCLAAMVVVGGMLGALLTFAPRPLYPTYAAVQGGALGPLADQQLAGTLMWVPAGIVYGLAAVVLLVGWLATIDEWVGAREAELDATSGAGR